MKVRNPPKKILFGTLQQIGTIFILILASDSEFIPIYPQVGFALKAKMLLYLGRHSWKLQRTPFRSFESGKNLVKLTSQNDLFIDSISGVARVESKPKWTSEGYLELQL